VKKAKKKGCDIGASVAFDGFEAPTLGFTSFSEYSLANKKPKDAAQLCF